MENKTKYFLQPGYIFVSKKPHFIHTVLGSCISVCLWDQANLYGGMNHYIYSRAKDGVRNGKYGNISIPYLIHLMIKMGSHKEHLRAHIVGGGQNLEFNSLIGSENVAIAQEILNRYGIKILTWDVGGENGRKVIFDNESGEIAVYKVNRIRASDWYK